MIIYRNLTEAIPGVYTACIGFFDGVHCGHRFLLQHVIEEARAAGTSSAVVTFANHPRTLIHPDEPMPLLQSLDEKLEQLAATGIDACFLLDFTPALRNLTAREFLTHILSEKLHLRTLVIGYDHRFGRNRAEGFDDYVRYGAECGMRLLREPVFDDGAGGHYSSSEIRRALSIGAASRAAQLLGRPYRLTGVVEGGHRVGRSLGFPTANLRVTHPEKLIPATGVYATRALLSDGASYPAMCNIGCRPTVEEGEKEITLEAHIIGFEGDLYGQILSIDFVDRLRDEVKYASLEELQAQLVCDRQATLRRLNTAEGDAQHQSM
jgi:riboflavin kinase/FMN adenylyltransferase